MSKTIRDPSPAPSDAQMDDVQAVCDTEMEMASFIYNHSCLLTTSAYTLVSGGDGGAPWFQEVEETLMAETSEAVLTLTTPYASSPSSLDAKGIQGADNPDETLDQMVNVGLESLGLLKQILAAQSTLFPSKSRGASEYVKDVLLQDIEDATNMDGELWKGIQGTTHRVLTMVNEEVSFSTTDTSSSTEPTSGKDATDAFADDLDQIRQEETMDAQGISLLVDALSSGRLVYSQDEQDLFVLSCNPSS
ncbi:MAG: hypothetical protein DHS80DRAFT_22002 [Piptocephalis tieghemiana]|nr:MAG: hypothetical protein DHS80DRAFT_22002 [Piptocephalis tieghemiana]